MDKEAYIGALTAKIATLYAHEHIRGAYTSYFERIAAAETLPEDCPEAVLRVNALHTAFLDNASHNSVCIAQVKQALDELGIYPKSRFYLVPRAYYSWPLQQRA